MEGLREWWTKTLLNEQSSAHPIFGERITIKVDGDVVILSGKVATVDERRAIEQEALDIPSVHTVVNRLRVTGREEVYHPQTIIAVFSDRDQARLAAAAVRIRHLHESRSPVLVDNPERAEEELRAPAERAGLGLDAIQRYIALVRQGKALLIDRVPEDDALRVIAALEGTNVESVYTLPPDPTHS